MKMPIREFAKISGVSVRTLHYYDEIDLLKPAFVDEQNGYRYYDDNSLEKMQEILFYRELDFPLKSISEILSSPDYDKHQALIRQKQLLILKRQRIDRLISAINDSMEGVKIMNTNAFDNSEYEKAREEYLQEAKNRWGNTEAYKEHSKKTKDYSEEKWYDVNAGLMSIFSEFSDCMINGAIPTDEKPQTLVKKLQDYITVNYYTCTNEILLGLGQMYAGDERFRNNIDSKASGTADFVCKAINASCGK